jgi:hypothetical protein
MWGLIDLLNLPHVLSGDHCPDFVLHDLPQLLKDVLAVTARIYVFA